MSAASKVTMGGLSSHELLSTPEARQGEVILTEAREGIQCFQHIIPLKDIGFKIFNLFTRAQDFHTYKEACFKKFGARFFKYVKHRIHFDKFKSAFWDQRKELLTEDAETPAALTMSKMGVGESPVIALAIGVKALKANLPEPHLLEFLAPNGNTGIHGCFLFGKGVGKEVLDNLPSRSKKSKKVALEFIEKLKSGIILDGAVLTKPMAARDVRQCSDFVSHIKALPSDTIFEVTRLHDREFDKYFELAEKLKKRIIEVLPSIPTDQSLTAVLEEYEPGFCAEGLVKRIPDTKWSKNAEKQKIWFEGTEEKAKEIFAYLKAHSIQASAPSLTKSGNWVVILTNPNFEQIECLPSFESWKKKQKPDEKEHSDKSSENGPVACAKELENRIPNTKWKKNVELRKVWFEGTEEKTKEILKYLKAHCIKAFRSAIKESGNWAVMLTKPDFELIKKLPPFEQWRIRNLLEKRE